MGNKMAVSGLVMQTIQTAIVNTSFMGNKMTVSGLVMRTIQTAIVNTSLWVTK